MTRAITEPYDDKLFEIATDEGGNEFLRYKEGKAPKTRPRAATPPLRDASPAPDDTATDVTPKKKTPKKET